MPGLSLHRSLIDVARRLPAHTGIDAYHMVGGSLAARQETEICLLTAARLAVHANGDEADPWLRFVAAVRASAAETIKRQQFSPQLGKLAADVGQVALELRWKPSQALCMPMG